MLLQPFDARTRAPQRATRPRRALETRMRRWALWSLSLLIVTALAGAETIYRIELRGDKHVLSKDRPIRKGSLILFHLYSNGVLTSLPEEQVVRITPAETSAPSRAPESSQRMDQPARPQSASPDSTPAPAGRTQASPAAASLAPEPVGPNPSPTPGAEPPPAPATGKVPQESSRPAYVPPRISRDRISLDDAVRLTLENAPEIRRARQEVRSRKGLYQQASGQFDPAIVFSPSFDRGLGVLLSGQLKSEIQRRDALRIPADILEQVANDLERDLLAGVPGPIFPACRDLAPITITGIRDSISPTGLAGFDVICLDPNSSEARRIQAFQDILATLMATEPDPQRRADYLRIQGSARDFYRDILFRFIGGARRAVTRLREQLERLGPLPKVDVRDTLTLNLRYPIPFRDGLIVTPAVLIQGVRNNFQDKPSNPGFGGKGVPTTFQAAFGLSLDVPLAKGSGTISVGAPERAARLNFEASLETLAQTASESIRNTGLAYWGLGAAQERLALLERSAASQRRITELSEALVGADEIPRSEMDRIKARTSDAEASVAQARQALVAARIGLARAMGTAVYDVNDAPLASDPLPESGEISRLDETPLQTLVESAVRSRSDVKSLRRRESASEELLKAARFDLKPRLDLSLEADYRGLHENVMKNTFYWKGYWNAMTGRLTGPSVQANLNLNLPFKNNAARGRLVQAHALRDQSEISARNLERIVRSRTVEVANSARQAAREVEVRKESVAQYDQTTRSAFEQYRAGEISLLDAILTERDSTQALLDLVAARQTFASRTIQLRFETGSILRYSTTGEDVVFGAVEPSGLRFQRSP